MDRDKLPHSYWIENPTPGKAPEEWIKLWKIASKGDGSKGIYQWYNIRGNSTGAGATNVKPTSSPIIPYAEWKAAIEGTTTAVQEDYSISAIKDKNIAIHCPTKDSHDKVLSVIRDSKATIIHESHHNWQYSKEHCFKITNTLMYGDTRHYTDSGFQIITAEQFLKANSKPALEKKEYAKGDWVVVTSEEKSGSSNKNGDCKQITHVKQGFLCGKDRPVYNLNPEGKDMGAWECDDTIRLATQEEINIATSKVTTEFKAGDWVTCCPGYTDVYGSDYGGSGYKEGFTFKINQVDGTDPKGVIWPDRDGKKGGGGIYYKCLRYATGEEVQKSTGSTQDAVKWKVGDWFCYQGRDNHQITKVEGDKVYVSTSYQDVGYTIAQMDKNYGTVWVPIPPPEPEIFWKVGDIVERLPGDGQGYSEDIKPGTRGTVLASCSNLNTRDKKGITGANIKWDNSDQYNCLPENFKVVTSDIICISEDGVSLSVGQIGYWVENNERLNGDLAWEYHGSTTMCKDHKTSSLSCAKYKVFSTEAAAKKWLQQQSFEEWKVGDKLPSEWLNQQIYIRGGKNGKLQSPGGNFRDSYVERVEDGKALIANTQDVWLPPKTKENTNTSNNQSLINNQKPTQNVTEQPEYSGTAVLLADYQGLQRGQARTGTPIRCGGQPGYVEIGRKSHGKEISSM